MELTQEQPFYPEPTPEAAPPTQEQAPLPSSSTVTPVSIPVAAAPEAPAVPVQMAIVPEANIEQPLPLELIPTEQLLVFKGKKDDTSLSQFAQSVLEQRKS